MADTSKTAKTAAENRADNDPNVKVAADTGTVSNTARPDDEEGKRQEEARKEAETRLEERREDPRVFRTADTDDVSLGWTVQQGAAPAGVEPIPGTVVTVDELPDPAVQKAAGINPLQANAGLNVVNTEEERVKARGGDLDKVSAAREAYGNVEGLRDGKINVNDNTRDENKR